MEKTAEKLISWTCSECDALLGYSSKENDTEMRIKYKDLYIKVRGIIVVKCRKCGKDNTIKEEQFEYYLAHKKEIDDAIAVKKQNPQK